MISGGPTSQICLKTVASSKLWRASLVTGMSTRRRAMTGEVTSGRGEPQMLEKYRSRRLHVSGGGCDLFYANRSGEGGSKTSKLFT